MKYAVSFHYKSTVVVDAENPDEAYRLASEADDREDICYTDVYDVEEIDEDEGDDE